jgi:hypothetical protein
MSPARTYGHSAAGAGASRTNSQASVTEIRVTGHPPSWIRKT